MRVIKSGEIEKQCKHCNSIIGMFLHEIHYVGPDYDEGDAAYSYWDCPACKKKNVTTSTMSDWSDD